MDLAMDNLGRDNTPRRVTGVDHQLRGLYDCGIVIVGVVRRDQHAVIFRDSFNRDTCHAQVIVPASPDRWEVWVVVVNLCLLSLQQLNNFERRRLPKIVDIFFVRDAKHKNPSAVK